MSNVDEVVEHCALVIKNASRDMRLFEAVASYETADAQDRSKYDSIMRDTLDMIYSNTKNVCGVEICSFTSSLSSIMMRITANDINDSTLIQSMRSAKDIVYWGTINTEYSYPVANNARYFVYACPIRPHLASSPVGCIFVALSEYTLEKIVSHRSASSNARVILCDGKGNVITSNANDISPQFEPEENYGYIYAGNGDQTILMDNNRYYVSHAYSEVTDWAILVMTEYSAMTNSPNILFAVVAALLLALLLTGITYSVSLSMTEPIEDIMEKMHEISVDKHYPRVSQDGNDEIACLGAEFNKMSEKIHELVQQKTDAMKAENKAQLQALQAQICPHFLYNTLDAVNWMAYCSDNQEICDLVTELSKFFRISLNFGKEEYTLKDELEHVTSYCNIQKLRFGNNIHYIEDVPDELLKCRVIKILLQPLVENAINHGFAFQHYMGTIKIKAYTFNGCLYIQVADDGVGLHYLDDKVESPIRHSGYGLSNAIERIQLNFGPEYGIKLYDNEPRGTIAEICLPLIMQEETYNVKKCARRR